MLTCAIDDRGRYCYENQPGIGAWNLNKFGEALGVVMSRERLIKEFKDNYVPTYQAAYLSTMRRKVHSCAFRVYVC